MLTADEEWSTRASTTSHSLWDLQSDAPGYSADPPDTRGSPMASPSGAGRSGATPSLPKRQPGIGDPGLRERWEDVDEDTMAAAIAADARVMEALRTGAPVDWKGDPIVVRPGDVLPLGITPPPSPADDVDNVNG